MIGDSLRNTVFFACYAVLLLASVLSAGYKLQPCRILSRFGTLLRSARETFAKSSAGIDEVGLLVQAKLQQQKVDHVWWCFPGLCVCATPLTAYSMYNIMMGLPRSYSLAQDVLHTLMHGMFILVSVCPVVISWRTIDGFVCALTLAFAVQTSPWFIDPDTGLLTIAAVTAVAGFLNIARRSVLVSAACNSVLAASILSTLMVHTQVIFLRPVLLAVSVPLILSLFPAFAYVLDASIGKGIRNSLEMEVAKEVISAASALLRSCCDVMVETDVEGKMLSPARDLGGFLLRGPDRCFQGSKLSELFSLEDDRRKFLGKLRSVEPSATGLAEAMHVRMKDGNDALLEVELLWFGFGHVDGTRHYMVGLREFSDFSQKHKKKRSRRRRRRRRQRGSRAEGGSSESSVASDSEEVSEQSGTSESRATSEGTISMEVQVAALTVDATEEGLPIQGYSPGFRSRIGRVQMGASLTESVHGKEDFVGWLQGSLNSMCSGSAVPDYQVTLNMRQGRMTAVCRVMLGSEDEPPSLSNVELVFFNIRQGRGRGRSHHDHLRGTPVARMSL